MIRAAFVLLLVAGIAFATRSFLPANATVTGSGAALAFGFLLLAAMQTAHIFHELKLPHLTGFILCGALFGPEVLRLITPSMLEDLALVKKVAVGLIALTAGCELNFASLWPKMRTIGAIVVASLFVCACMLFLFFYAISSELPFMAELEPAQRAVISLILANVLCARSPAVVISILKESRSAGPLSELALSTVVVADLTVVIAFAFSDSLAHKVFPVAGAVETSIFGTLAAHILGSIVVGIGIALIFQLYIRRVRQRIGLFVFVVLFVVAEAGRAYHIDPLLVGLSAGLFLENVSPVSGHEVVHETEIAAMPTFAVFFAVVGAEVHLHAFVSVALFAVLAALVRACGLATGTAIASRIVKLDPAIARKVPFGMFPQAGVAIGLANLVASSFGPWGAQAATLILGTVVINEMLGPVLFRAALARAGEIGHKRDQSLADMPSHAAVSEPDIQT